MHKEYFKLAYHTFGFIVSIIVVVMIAMKSSSGLSTQNELYYLAIGITIGFYMKRSIDFFINFYKKLSLKKNQIENY